jgi:hypothetical protein
MAGGYAATRLVLAACMGRVTGVTRPPILTYIDAEADDSTMRRNPGAEDPVARLQEEARWSSFTNSWSRRPHEPWWTPFAEAA